MAVFGRGLVMLGCGDASWCSMTYGLRSSDARVISATCSGREVVEPGARAKTSVLDVIGCHGRDRLSESQITLRYYQIRKLII